MGILSLPGTKGAAQYAVDKSAKALAKAEEGAQGVGDFFGNVSSHMFGGAMMGGVGNTALYANAGDGYNGVQGYDQAFFSGATAGAIAGGALGAYRGVGRATASDAKIARLQAKHEKNLAVLARRSGGGGGGGRQPNRIGLSPLDQARELIAGDRAGGFTPGAGRGRMKTSTSTPPMNPVSTAQAPTPAVAAATPTPTPSQAASTTSSPKPQRISSPGPFPKSPIQQNMAASQAHGSTPRISNLNAKSNPFEDLNNALGANGPDPIAGLAGALGAKPRMRMKAGLGDQMTEKRQKLRDLFAQGRLEAEFEGLM